MSWVYQIEASALRDLRRIGPQATRAIMAYLDERVAGNEDPKRFGKPLRGTLRGLWRYQVGDYRIICQILDQKLIVLVVAVGHRRGVYD